MAKTVSFTDGPQAWAKASLWLALAACAPAPQPTSTPAASPEGEPLDPAQIDAELEGDYTRLSGSWYSDEYGTVQLTFEDDLHFSGIYSDGAVTGHVDVERGALVFEWADDASVGRGEWVIIDAETLRGTWGVGASSSNGGDWSLTR